MDSDGKTPDANKTATSSEIQVSDKVETTANTKVPLEEKRKLHHHNKPSKSSVIPVQTIKHPGTEIEGVVRVTFTMETQKILNCIVDHHVTKEMPWTHVNKSTALELQDCLPIIEEIKNLSGDKLLIGYDTNAKEKTQFFVCITEDAECSALDILERIKKQRMFRIENSICRKARHWVSLGSETEVDATIVKNSRPLFEVEALTDVRRLRRPAQFSDFDAIPMKLGPPRCVVNSVERNRIDTAVQAAQEMHEAVAQTDPGLPTNAWTQYDFKMDGNEPLTDDLVVFLNTVIGDVEDKLAYNSIFDLLKNDYDTLAKTPEDTRTPKQNALRDYLTFMNVTICKGKVISSVAWHPKWPGIAAVAYVNNVRDGNELQQEKYDDEVLDVVFGENTVLIWSFKDTINPMLILETPSAVHCLKFCPFKENLLIGGCMNGQILLWDTTNWLARAEADHTEGSQKALHELIPWMKEFKPELNLQPTAMSFLKFSHSACVTGIQWLPPSWKVSSRGKVTVVKEEVDTVQFITCSEDGSVQFWDLKPEITADVESSEERCKKRSRIRPGALRLDVSSYCVLHQMFRPHFKINIMLANTEIPLPLRSMSYKVPSITYEGGDYMAGETMFHNPDLEDCQPSMEIFLGTSHGTLLLATWNGCDDESGDDVFNVETCQYQLWGDGHDGEIHTTARSPFLHNIILSIGGSIFAIWMESRKGEPIIEKRSNYLLTSGAWSVHRPSMFFITREDGSVDIWDLLKSSYEPIMTQSLSGKTIREIHFHKLPLPYNVISIADYNGAFRTFLLPTHYQYVDADDLKNTCQFVGHEVACREQMAEWFENWKVRNADLLHQRREDERMKEERKRKEEQAQKAKLKMDLKQKQYLESQMAIEAKKHSSKNKREERAIECLKKKEEQHMTQVIIAKKKVNLSELDTKIVPLQVLNEEKEIIHQAIRDNKKVAEKNFQELVDVLFPNLYDDESDISTPREHLSKEFEQFDELFKSQYQECKAAAKIKIKNHVHKRDLTWKEILLQANERHHFMDTGLVGKTFHHQRYNIYRQQNVVPKKISRHKSRKLIEVPDQAKVPDKPDPVDLVMTPLQEALSKTFV